MNLQPAQNQCLYRTERGMVQLNDNSSVYTIQFGNMLLYLNQDNFMAFSGFILRSTKKDIEKRVCKQSGKIILQPDKAWCNYAFTVNEFLFLQELLAGASCIIQISTDIKSILN